MSFLYRFADLIGRLKICQNLHSDTSKPFSRQTENAAKKIARKQCTNLLLQPATEVRSWLNSFNTIIADGEGVLWIYDKPIPGAIDALNQLKASGKQIYVCTNNSTQTRQQHTFKAERLGLNIHLQFLKYAYVIGAEALTTELDAAGIVLHNDSGPDIMHETVAKFATEFRKEANVGAVIVGYDTHFSFCKLAKAATYLKNPDCLFLATNVDASSYTGDMMLPGTGSFVAAIEYCTGRKAFVIGKPSANMCMQYIETGLIQPANTLMMGDNYQTDMPFGHNLGFQTLLVGTGTHTWSDVLHLKKLNGNLAKHFMPDAYIPKFSDLNYFLRR
ncbi:pyridoxal phosphate phosphatase-like [Bactrocera tryoni]|uniref:pyridoxal phosphate phosphatase-like n=1 Tax=Bactrocera tryoni TaxID=59916 RepID=UPI001A97F3ED|nr:pyridoxal phosphate phosphatase-like [Bactrocera tryoni]